MSYRLVWPTLHLFDYFDLLVLAGFVVATFWRSGVASYQAALVVMLVLRFSHVLRTFTPVIVATFLFALLTELFIKSHPSQRVPMHLLVSVKSQLARKGMLGLAIRAVDFGSTRHWAIRVRHEGRDRVLNYRLPFADGTPPKIWCWRGGGGEYASIQRGRRSVLLKWCN
jgi:hypothetical protein